jgi:transcription elongation GreA/GreB family factor
MLLKKFSISEQTFIEEQIKDMEEELYAVSIGKSTTETGKFNLVFGGESGTVWNLQLDNSMDITKAQKQKLVDFGSSVKVLEWSTNGAYLIVAGENNNALELPLILKSHLPLLMKLVKILH